MESPNATRPAESHNWIPILGSASDRSLLCSPPQPIPQPDIDMDQILGATTMYSLPPTAPVRTVPEHLFTPSFSRPRARHDHLPPRYANRS